jgi:hypothetical protein
LKYSNYKFEAQFTIDSSTAKNQVLHPGKAMQKQYRFGPLFKPTLLTFNKKEASENILPFVCLYVYPAIADKQRTGEDALAATNTREEL